MFIGCSLTRVNASFKKIKTLFFTSFTFILHRSVPSPISAPIFPGYMKPLPQKYTIGSDWLAFSMCCDWLNRRVHS